MKLNLKSDVQEIHYSKQVPPLLITVFGIFSFGYFLIISVKNFFYKLRLFKEKKINAKVICVGNLTTGGVGKTPIVCALANYLAEKKYNVAIVSRGYGGELDNKKPNVVKGYKKILIDDAKLCGDEPYLLAQNTKNVPVITCRDRILGAKCAIERYFSDIIILDDGFSNRNIHKDLNILVVDSQKKFGNNFLLPLGPLREPTSEIKRAQKLVIVDKSTDESEDAKNTLCGLQKYCLPTFICKMVKDEYYNLLTGDKYTVIETQEALAFCAIGQPKQFYSYLENDFQVVHRQSFDDHHNYTKEDLENMFKMACEKGAKVLLTTEKDAVKIAPLLKKIKKIPLELFVLKLKLELDLDELLKE